MKWCGALYGRVSTDHNEQQESIRVQKEALVQYAKGCSIDIISQYFDEGYSGTNFNRPGIKYLKNDIEKGKINIILVKDLSRIGRNNALTLMFLDYLADKNTRLVAINDNYDTAKGEDDMVGIKTWFNEWYSRDISRKIKFALQHKKKSGEYLTAFAPYGYKKSETIKNKLEIDYFAASIIKSIFSMYINGYGFVKIAAALQERGILNPSRYSFYGRKSDKWEWTMIRKVISNPVYTGCSIQQKYSRKSFKNKSITRLPVSEWIIVENMHEPIIDKDTYDLAQKILNKRKDNIKYRSGTIEPHLFSTFLYCHDCGSVLYYKKDEKYGGVYRCSRYIKYGIKGCTSHYVKEEELKKIVTGEMKKLIGTNVDLESLINEIKGEFTFENKVSEELKCIRQEIKKGRNKIEILYKDRLNGVIGEELYLKLAGNIKIALAELEKQEELSKETGDFNDNNTKSYDLLYYIKNIMNFECGIDREGLERLIKRIEIFENGDILLYYNFLL